MGDLISPGVQVKEKDLTASVRSEPTSIGATAITASWGPMNEVVTINDETQLVDIFGKPDDLNYEYWFSAANFLAYTNTLRLVRMQQTGSVNACVSGTAVLIPNTTTWLVGDGDQGPFADGSANCGTTAARFPGNRGNSLKISYCWDAAGYYGAAVTTVATNNAAGGVAPTQVTVVSGTVLNVGDIISFGSALPAANATNKAIAAAEKGQKYKVTVISTNLATIVRYPASNAVGLKSAINGLTVSVDVNRNWEWYDQFDAAPDTTTWLNNIQKDRTGGSIPGPNLGKDELHAVVVDADGLITGTAGTLLEKFSSVSKSASGDSPAMEQASNTWAP